MGSHSCKKCKFYPLWHHLKSCAKKPYIFFFYQEIVFNPWNTFYPFKRGREKNFLPHYLLLSFPLFSFLHALLYFFNKISDQTMMLWHTCLFAIIFSAIVFSLLYSKTNTIELWKFQNCSTLQNITFSRSSTLASHEEKLPVLRSLTAEEVYGKRLSHFKNKCLHHEKSGGMSFIPGAYYSLFQIIYVPKYNFSYCMPSKTGSSTFISQLFQILPVKPPTKEFSFPHIRLMCKQSNTVPDYWGRVSCS